MKQGRRREFGGLELGSLFWLGLLGSAVYFAIMFAPPYFEAYEVKQVLREAANLAIREADDDRIRGFISEKCRQIGSHYEIRDGQELNLPGIVLLDSDVFVTRDAQAQSLVLQVRYTKHVNYPFTRKQRALTFSPSVEGDLAPVRW